MMIHFDLKQSVENYFSFLKKAPALIAVTLLSVPAITFLPVRSVLSTAKHYGCVPSLADCFCFFNAGLPFLALLFSFYMINQQKYDFTPSFIIRQKSKQHLWRKQCCYTFFTSVLFVLYTAVWVVIIGGAATGGKIINWNDVNGLYYFFYDTVSPLKTVFPVVGVFIGVFALTSVAMGMLELYMRWLTNRVLPGFLMIAAIPIFDSDPFSKSLNIYYGHCGIWYDQWTYPNLILNSFIYPVVWIAILYFLGNVYSRRKDFFNAYQKGQP